MFLISLRKLGQLKDNFDRLPMHLICCVLSLLFQQRGVCAAILAICVVHLIPFCLNKKIVLIVLSFFIGISSISVGSYPSHEFWDLIFYHLSSCSLLLSQNDFFVVSQASKACYILGPQVFSSPFLFGGGGGAAQPFAFKFFKNIFFYISMEEKCFMDMQSSVLFPALYSQVLLQSPAFSCRVTLFSDLSHFSLDSPSRLFCEAPLLQILSISYDSQICVCSPVLPSELQTYMSNSWVKSVVQDQITS